MNREGENGSYEVSVRPPPRFSLVASCGRKIRLHADRQPQQGDKNRVRLVLSSCWNRARPAGPEAMCKLLTEDSECFLEFNGTKMIKKGRGSSKSETFSHQQHSLFGPMT